VGCEEAKVHWCVDCEDAVVDRYMDAVFAVTGGRMLRCIAVLDL